MMNINTLRFSLFTDTSELDMEVQAFERIAKVMLATAQTFLDRNGLLRGLYEQRPDFRPDDNAIIRVLIGPSPKLSAFINQFAPDDIASARSDQIAALPLLAPGA